MADIRAWMADAGDAWQSAEPRIFYCRHCKEFGVLIFPVDLCPKCQSPHESIPLQEFVRQAADLLGATDQESRLGMALLLGLGLLKEVFSTHTGGES
jgi:hypothetical protein